MRRGTPKVRLTGCDAVIGEARARIPFHCDSACLVAVPLLLVRVQIEAAGKKRASGLSSDCLPPRWFQKDTTKTYSEEVEAQIGAFAKAKESYLLAGQTPSTVVDLWLRAFPRILEEGSKLGLNPLQCSFGSSFLERAVIDAICRLRGVSFFDALRQDMLGMKTSVDLPPAPVREFICRHTVGIEDALLVGEIPPGARVEDGLPQALEEDVETYGLYHFKVRLSGDHDADLERLSRLTVLLSQRCRRGYRVSLDGNELYRQASDVVALIEALRSQPYGDQFVDSVLYVEQPLRRDVALEPGMAEDIRRLAALKPVIIDESDDLPDSFERAVRLGYHGVAHKNCKGVLKSLRNRSLMRSLNAEAGQELYFQTGEDLVTLPVVSLQQDLATLSALGVEHVERNGHHYFRGLDHLPQREAGSALKEHADLYEERGGWGFLRVVEGRIHAESLQSPGYGYSCEIDFEERTPLEEWSFDRLGLG